MSARESWDRLYEKEGRPWKGASDEQLPLHGRVLELGIGNGKNLSSFPADVEVIGLDFSRSALLSCGSRRVVHMVQADVIALPFREGSVANVSASHILGHLKASARTKAAAEIERVLRKGGTLYVSVFGEEDMRCGSGREVEERTFERGNGISCHYFQEDEIPALFPGLTALRSWERRLAKRYHGQAETRQERRFLLVK